MSPLGWVEFCCSSERADRNLNVVDEILGEIDCQEAPQATIIALFILSDIPPKAYYSPTKGQPEELGAAARKPDKPTDPKKLL